MVYATTFCKLFIVYSNEMFFFISNILSEYFDKIFHDYPRSLPHYINKIPCYNLGYLLSNFVFSKNFFFSFRKVLTIYT